jgi:hypothetical protein
MFSDSGYRKCRYDKVMETTELFSLFWKHLEAHRFRCLEAFGSSLFSLFRSICKFTIFAIWKHLEAHQFRCLALF